MLWSLFVSPAATVEVVGVIVTAVVGLASLAILVWTAYTHVNPVIIRRARLPGADPDVSTNDGLYFVIYNRKTYPITLDELRLAGPVGMNTYGVEHSVVRAHGSNDAIEFPWSLQAKERLAIWVNVVAERSVELGNMYFALTYGGDKQARTNRFHATLTGRNTESQGSMLRLKLPWGDANRQDRPLIIAAALLFAGAVSFAVLVVAVWEASDAGDGGRADGLLTIISGFHFAGNAGSAQEYSGSSLGRNSAIFDPPADTQRFIAHLEWDFRELGGSEELILVLDKFDGMGWRHHANATGPTPLHLSVEPIDPRVETIRVRILVPADGAVVDQPFDAALTAWGQPKPKD